MNAQHVVHVSPAARRRFALVRLSAASIVVASAVAVGVAVRLAPPPASEAPPTMPAVAAAPTAPAADTDFAETPRARFYMGEPAVL